jgi:hypothetical protein
MKEKSKLIRQSISPFCIVVLFFLLTSCTEESAQVVDPEKLVEIGDQVLVNYSCRFADTNELVATTLQSVDEDETIAKWDQYIPESLFNPQYIRATTKESLDNDKKSIIFTKPLEFQDSVKEFISIDMLGKSLGDKGSFVHEGEVRPISDGNTAISLPRRKRRPKWFIEDRTLERSHFRETAPMEGEVLETPEINLYWKAVSVNATHIKGLFLPKTYETHINDYFGNSTLVDEGDFYYIVVDPVKGRLVRLGGLMGVISSVRNDSFSLDFRHPYAYKKLQCDYEITPEYIKKKPKTTE